MRGFSRIVFGRGGEDQEEASTKLVRKIKLKVGPVMLINEKHSQLKFEGEEMWV